MGILPVVKRVRWIVPICTALVLIAFFAVVLLRRRDHSPTYLGKTFFEWMAADAALHDGDDASQVLDAIQHIGTNNFPFLLQTLDYEPPLWRLKVRAAIPNFMWVHFDSPLQRLLQDRRDDQAGEAEMAFFDLADQAAPAIPGLTNLLHHWDRPATCERALYILAAIGTNGLEHVVATLTNSSCPDVIRLYALVAIGNLGTNTDYAVPAVISSLSDEYFGPDAAHYLGQFSSQPDLVVPALAKCLQSGSPELIASATAALEGFGPKAVPAVPALLVAATNTDPKIHAAVTNAIQFIAPQEFQKLAH